MFDTFPPVVHSILLRCSIVLSCAASVRADDPRAFFETKIRPVLVAHCYQCHASDSEEIGGKLLLDSAKAMRQGGESGPAVVPGKPEQSLILQAMRYDDPQMPPDQPLPESIVNDFAKWIAEGAVDPRQENPAAEHVSTFDEASLWSFRARTRPEIPTVIRQDWARDPIDHFVLHRLEAAKLLPTVDAAPETLLRRLYCDLIGLPPSFEEIRAFQDACRRDRDTAIQRVVDRLLMSPQFGVRWGRYWLDVARYAESNGDDGLGRNATFPHAWRYRDYVIDAINDDTPYDRFMTEQIAGDLLPAATAAERSRNLVATGFLAIGSKPAAAMNKNFQMDIVDDQINAVGTAFMGLSIACARCHDHKHDPISTRDYYALAGIFSSTETLYGLAANEKLTAPPTELHELRRDWSPQQGQRDLEVTPAFDPHYAESVAELDPLSLEILQSDPSSLQTEGKIEFSQDQFAAVDTARLAGKFVEPTQGYSVAFWFRNAVKNDARPITAYLFSRAPRDDKKLMGDHLGIGGTHEKSRTGKLFVFNGTQDTESVAGSTVIEAGSWNHIAMVRNADQMKVFLNGYLEIDAKVPSHVGETLDFFLAARSDHFAPLQGNIAHLAIFTRALTDAEAGQLFDASGQMRRAVEPVALAMGVREKPKPADCKIHVNGDIGKLGPVVPRGFLVAYRSHAPSPPEQESRYPIDADQSGRLQLASWLTDPDHPQTARVIVNRVWLRLFGRGIVATPDDFGVYGARPTHPQLLDHLAGRLVDGGWSLKRLIRAIVMTRTYGLDSRGPEQLFQADPDHGMFGWHSRRRLDADTLRDSILACSGQLDHSPGRGSAIAKVDALINWPPGEATNLHRPSHHRSVYLSLLRHSPPPELAAFDFPDAIAPLGRRDETALPTHALYLLNGPFLVEQARCVAELSAQASLPSDGHRVQWLFRRILQRDPSDLEQRQSIRHVHRIVGSHHNDHGGDASQAWASLSQALFMTNEFRYID